MSGNYKTVLIKVEEEPKRKKRPAKEEVETWGTVKFQLPLFPLATVFNSAHVRSKDRKINRKYPGTLQL